MDRLLLAFIVVLIGVLTGRLTTAAIEDWPAGRAKTAVVSDERLAETASKDTDDLLRERLTCDLRRFNLIGAGLADALCPPDDEQERLLWPRP